LANVPGNANISSATWILFTDTPINPGGRNPRGWVAHPRVTVGKARYSGVNYAIPHSPFPSYAPAPGSTLSGRILLDTNGAVVQAANNPNTVRTGILQTLSSKLLVNDDAILTAVGSNAAPDNAARFDALDEAVAAIPTLTYTSQFSGIDAALGNLITNVTRNTLVEGVVEGTNFIGLLNDLSVELSGGSPAYQRQPVVWSTPFNGIVTNTLDIVFNVASGSTIGFIGGYDLVGNGVLQFSYACAEVEANSQSVYTIPAGTLQLVATVQ
jgi:hypothetical protein